MEKGIVIAVAVAALVVFAASVIGLVALTADSDSAALLFTRPTGIAGPLSWGPLTVASDWAFRCLGVTEGSTLTRVFFLQLVGALFTFASGWFVVRIVMRLMSL